MRIVLVQKPSDTSVILNQVKSADHQLVSSGFQKLMELVGTFHGIDLSELTIIRIMIPSWTGPMTIERNWTNYFLVLSVSPGRDLSPSRTGNVRKVGKTVY